ncbi:hypothetical protein [Celeribacter marinus]|uniref:hypothetical protein n=1 Tax=Celeribacter marinus TaxID=1397108 RepID=UPI003F6C2C92
MSYNFLTPLIAVFVCVASPALAVCAGNQEAVFACSVGSKAVELCLTPDESRVTYRFGTAGAPEIELTRDFDEIAMLPWSGIGRSIWDRVTVHNREFSYTLSWSYDKVDQEMSGALEVARAGRVLATLACDVSGEAGTVFELDTLNFAMQDAGFCRADTAKPLRAGPCE